MFYTNWPNDVHIGKHSWTKNDVQFFVVKTNLLDDHDSQIGELGLYEEFLELVVIHIG
jgi:hypothetical protein